MLKKLSSQCWIWILLTWVLAIAIDMMNIDLQANYTDLGEFKVYRGKKNSADVGRVISFNGDTGETNLLFGPLISITRHFYRKLNDFACLLLFFFFWKTELNAWDEDECNTFVGTDSTVFPAMQIHHEG